MRASTYDEQVKALVGWPQCQTTLTLTLLMLDEEEAATDGTAVVAGRQEVEKTRMKAAEVQVRRMFLSCCCCSVLDDYLMSWAVYILDNSIIKQI